MSTIKHLKDKGFNVVKDKDGIVRFEEKSNIREKDVDFFDKRINFLKKNEFKIEKDEDSVVTLKKI
jgi:predicted nucleotidyltransferase